MIFIPSSPLLSFLGLSFASFFLCHVSSSVFCFHVLLFPAHILKVKSYKSVRMSEHLPKSNYSSFCQSTSFRFEHAQYASSLVDRGLVVILLNCWLNYRCSLLGCFFLSNISFLHSLLMIHSASLNLSSLIFLYHVHIFPAFPLLLKMDSGKTAWTLSCFSITFSVDMLTLS